MSKWIALAAGGTGGHMFPAQALAEEMKRRGWNTLLLTDARGMRYADQFPADEIVTLKAANPNVRGVVGKASMALTMWGGVRQASKALKTLKPAFAVGFGGYPSAPGLFAAHSRGVMYGVHEQNAVLGRVNRKAAKGAKFIAHGFPVLERLPKVKGDVVQTGNPVRDAVLAAVATPYEPPSAGHPLRVLVFGGSQGANLFGRVFAPAFASLPEEIRRRLAVTHQASDDIHKEVEEIYRSAGIQAEIAPFFKDLPERIAASHLVISRSGASSVTELSVIGRPSLLVPLKIAMDNHQFGNAQVLVNAGAAEILLEDDATPEAAAALLLPRLIDPEGLARAAEAAKGQVPHDASQRLGDMIEGLLKD